VELHTTNGQEARMEKIPRKPRRWRRALLAWGRRLRDGAATFRVLIVERATSGLAAKAIHQLLGCARSQVYRVLGRFLQSGRIGLLDRRGDNGRRIADPHFDAVVRQLVEGCPQDHGYSRPTWTRELLILVAYDKTGIRVSLTSMTRVLQRIRARRGRPKPAVECRLSARQKRRRLAKLQHLLKHLRPDEVAVYEDEADVHLNPKIGLDWMARGQQKQVLTPGQNEKAYIAGALDARDGTVLWVGDAKKTSSLFIAMLERLCQAYPNAKRIYVILDNYGIHSSSQTKLALRRLPTIHLHFLPPYCPDHNRIERLWQDLHANVTRNHRHTNLLDLCQAVAAWLDNASPWPSSMRPPATPTQSPQRSCRPPKNARILIPCPR
jgi:transposase